jgi:hypothetical protein
MAAKKNGADNPETTSPATTSPAVGMVTILYSRSGDLYRVHSMEKRCWLSVKVYPLPASQLPGDELYLGPSMTADGGSWRKAYAVTWRAIWPGDRATLPADDPLVRD